MRSAPSGAPGPRDMLKKHHQFFASMLWLADMAVVLLSFALAHSLRFSWQSVLPARWGISPDEETRATLLAIVIIWSLVFRLSGLYEPRRTGRLLDETFSILKATVIGVALMVSAFYFFREARYSRLTLGLFAVLSFANLSLCRALTRRLLWTLRRRGFNLRHVLIVGAGDLAQALVQRLDENSALGMNVVGLLSEDTDKLGSAVAGKPVLGRYDEVRTLVRERDIDQVFVALPLDRHSHFEAVLHDLAEEIVDILVVPDLVQYYTLRGGVEELGGLPIVHLQNGPAVGWDAVAKRAFDLFFAALLLLAIGPVMLVTALLVKLGSPGPVFYRQERMGLDGKLFWMLKFRSMHSDAEQQSGAVWASQSDDRTTALGQWMRKFSIDELPQFINVLLGDMSLVGPRPERPVFIDQFKKQIPRYNLRHKVKAGITGLAQVEGGRGQTSLQKRIERDLYYIEHWSLWLDLKILVRTALGGFLSRNAY